MKTYALLCALVLAAIAAEAQQPTPGNPDALSAGSAVIADLQGEVTCRAADGSALTRQKGQTLPAGTNIETGKGSILLNLADGSQVLIKSHTRVQLQVPEKSGGNFLQLFLGNLLAKVQKRLGVEPSFRMGTPTAVITVRGTRFSVEVTKKNKTIVEVYEGLVEVTGLAAPSRPVMVRPGFSTQVQQEGTPENPRSLQGPGGNDSSENEKVGPRGQGINNEGDRSGSGTRQSSGGEKPD